MVWTAPSWQGLSSRLKQLVGAASPRLQAEAVVILCALGARMHRQFIAITVVSALFPANLFAATQYNDVACQADQHHQVNAPGQLVVTEYSFAFQKSFCPTRRIDLKVPIPISGKLPLYTWFRLQGDIAYLHTAQSRRPLIASFYLLIGDKWTFQTSLPLSYINISQAAAEASFDGTFDCGVFADKWSLDTPGVYYIQIEQDGAKLTRRWKLQVSGDRRGDR